ncbi:Putative ribonuclease H protein [Dendrobium catenatum]|uniref:Ribonuclease H protein n=1 Tax=Dendrobium catenatum TaxID=906689 RepID=A0A2I0WEM9_9ASPA|nr:Putative ribonuclease H protein [Dendrobium catenatum]
MENTYLLDDYIANLNLLNTAKINLAHLHDQEENFWKQKANAKFTTEGDRNTKFFHAIANRNRSNNFICKIMNDDGSFIESDSSICNSGVDYFKNTFNDSFCNSPITNPAIIPKIIDDNDNILLCCPPSELEIYNVIMDLNGDSVAGPDGFTTKFFQKMWSIIKKDIIDVVNDLFVGNPYPKFFTSTNIVLIPKVNGANKWKNFRPISLCSFFNKLISKIISNRLVNILPRIISINQTGFVKGRSIFDNVLLTQEMAHEINTKSKGGNIIVKLDISKAYDNLNWNFLYKVLSLVGFSNVFINLIKNSIENCYFFVIINGRNHDFFKSSKGLRQCDNLSPALFIIAMEFFSRGIDDLYLRNPKLYYRTIRGIHISHLSFADDFILFSNGSINNIKLLHNFLDYFNKVSGLAINKEKSSFIAGKTINRERILAIQRCCGFHSKSLPITYLGTPIYKGKKRSLLFEDIFAHFQKKLNHWSSNFLSYGGRLVLIKSVLNSIPVYLFHTLQLSATICLRIERLINKFFWGSKYSNGIRWSSWNNICGELKEGGLGCKNLTDLSQAFSHKLWFYFRTNSSLWAHFMHAKYCKNLHPLLGEYKTYDSHT